MMIVLQADLVLTQRTIVVVIKVIVVIEEGQTVDMIGND